MNLGASITSVLYSDMDESSPLLFQSNKHCIATRHTGWLLPPHVFADDVARRRDTALQNEIQTRLFGRTLNPRRQHVSQTCLLSCCYIEYPVAEEGSVGMLFTFNMRFDYRAERRTGLDSSLTLLTLSWALQTVFDND